MQQYLDLLREVYTTGEDKPDRTGVGTRSLFGRQVEYDLTEGFPILTTKAINFRAVKAELLWFLRGSTNARTLNKLGAKIWDRWADETGELGPIYGHQWRNAGATPITTQLGEFPTGVYLFDGTDQIGDVVDQLKINPHSRRIIVCSWQVKDIPRMNLPPCHVLCQFYVREGQFLDCKLYQRSCDLFIGGPFNIAQYALLTHHIARLTDFIPGRFIHSFGDVHIYRNHSDQVEEQLSRKPTDLPRLVDSGVKFLNSIDAWEVEDYMLDRYYPQAHIPAPVAV